MIGIFHALEIPALGSISTNDALLLQGFQKTKEAIYTEFSNKTIIDLGSGLSDFLEYIGNHSDAKRLVAIDPIYQNDSEYKKAIIRTQRLIETIRTRVKKGWDENQNDEIFRILQSLDERDSVLDTALSRRQSALLEYVGELKIEDIKTADYIFITFLLEHIFDWEVFLKNIESNIKIGGKILISDFYLRSPVQKLLQRMESGDDTIKVLGKDQRQRIAIEISHSI